MRRFFRSSVQDSVQRLNLLGALVQRSFSTITKFEPANARIDSVSKCLLSDIGQRGLLKSRTAELVPKCPMPTFAPSRSQRQQVFMRGRVVPNTSRAIVSVIPKVTVEEKSLEKDWLAQPWHIKSNNETEKTKYEDNLKLLKIKAEVKRNSEISSTPKSYNPKATNISEYVKTANVEKPGNFEAYKKGWLDQEKNIMDSVFRWTQPIFISPYSENVFDTELSMLSDGFLPPLMGVPPVETRNPTASKDCNKGSHNQEQTSLHGQLTFSIQSVEKQCILSLTTAGCKMAFKCDQVPLSCVITSIDDVDTIIQLKLPNCKLTNMTDLNKEFQK